VKSIQWSDFEKVELCVGTITRVEDFPDARQPAYKIWADFGELGVMKSSAQVTQLYGKEELLERQIIGVVNLLPKQIGGFMSQFLVTGFVLENGQVVLAQPERKVPNGTRLS
jgi:tRNA-binding protein